MSKTVTLIKGNTYTYNKVKYVKSVPKAVDATTAKYLQETGHFVVTGGDTSQKDNSPSVKTQEAPKKIKIRKPDEDASASSKDGEYEELPIFRSKKDLAKYAEEKYGFTFDVDTKEAKMQDMRDILDKYLISKVKPPVPEPVIEV